MAGRRHHNRDNDDPLHHLTPGGVQQNGRNPTVSALEELMRRQGVDDAWATLEDMQNQGLATDRFTVSRMLMKTVCDGRNRPNPSKVYRGIALVERFIQIQPEEADEVLFNALLDTCCRIKDLARLEQTVHRMKELQIYPSHVTLGILVKAYGQAGDISRVLKVWEEMEDQRRQANAVTYGCMIDACVKCGHMDKAMEIFHDMKRRRKHRNTILYTTLIKGYGLEKDLRNALMLFREMKEEGVPYNTITYNSIIDACIKCSDVQIAEELLREMMSQGNSLEPDLITYSTLLKGYCHVGDLDKALQVAETIKACGLKCDELVYNTLMDGCVKANDLSAGIGLFAEMTQAGMKPSSITHSILVRLYQRNGYRGDCFDAVAQLYQHHGLERPNAAMERAGKGSNNGRRERGRGGQGGNSNQREQQQSHQREQAAIDSSGWGEQGVAPHMQPAPPPHQGFPGHGMPPVGPGPYGGAHPSMMLGDHLSPYPDQDLDPLLNVHAPHSALGNVPYMPVEALRGNVPCNMQHMAVLGRGTSPDGSHYAGMPGMDERMAMFMPPSPQSRGLGMPGMPPGAPWFPTGPMGGAIVGVAPKAPPGAQQDMYAMGMMAHNGAAGPPGNNHVPPFDPRRFPRGRPQLGGLDGHHGSGLDPQALGHPPPWMDGLSYPVPTMPGHPKGYLDRSMMPEGGPPVVGVPCGGGPGDFTEY